jgi:hypothetical protein
MLHPPADIEQLPGADLVTQGLDDLETGRDTAAAALVRMAAPRLRAVGLAVPAGRAGNPGHRLYELLAQEDRASAHSRYNALVGRVVSFVRAADHARTG